MTNKETREEIYRLLALNRLLSQNDNNEKQLRTLNNLKLQKLKKTLLKSTNNQSYHALRLVL